MILRLKLDKKGKVKDEKDKNYMYDGTKYER